MKLWEKYKNSSLQVKASLWYTICNFLQKGISLIVVPIYVRLLTTAEYGEWSVFQSWRDILIIFASLNLYAGVYTKTLVDNKNDRDGYTSSMQGLGTVITVIFLLFYLLTREWCNNLINLKTPYALLLFLYFMVYPAFSFWNTRQRVEYRYKKTIIVTVFTSFLTPVISILLIKCTELRANALVLGFLLVQCGVGSVFYVYHFAKGKCFFNWKYWKYAIKFNVPLIPHYLSLMVLGQADRIMIKELCGEDEAGIYSFAYQIASAITMFIAAVNGSRVPWTYECLKGKVFEKLRSVSNALCIMMGAITLLATLLSPDVISIIGTEKYRQATYVIPIVCLGVYFTFVYDLFCSIEFYYGETKYVTYASATGALSNVLLNAWLIPVYGFIAAAYTTMISYLIFMIMHYVFMHKVMKKEKITEKIYDERFIGFFSFMLSAIIFGGMLSFQNAIVRWLIILALTFAALIFKNKIISVLKSIKQ